MKLHAVELLEAFAAVFTGVVIVRLRCVFLHVPVEGGPLPTLVAAYFTPGGRDPACFIKAVNVITDTDKMDVKQIHTKISSLLNVDR